MELNYAKILKVNYVKKEMKDVLVVLEMILDVRLALGLQILMNVEYVRVEILGNL